MSADEDEKPAPMPARLLTGIQGLDLATLGSEEARDVDRLFQLEFQSLILAQVSDAIVSIGNDGRVTYLNASAEHQYEVAQIEVVGRPLSDLYAYR